ncbi:MAG: hypothetical protein UX08_C0012G0018 [Candidatus Collierbacteria bacterium GW2011_GWB1_45_35]|uniref:Uncharacterized protein n=1 Tax=Candidatus Collierbacteria bacterium GW2011_GWB2_45_17 TaxID=1618388 RepID=A0A837IQI6_9BACT|nr:MAG: hypothetical protein UW48_C0001G0124 [Microgenomates group bacterium GW2011_GWC1_44_23]KKT96244.1 MAG: hypothetical protein UW96_C0001G0122 [Candidatus Collierbacteria bacterium GW2011_GWA1_45_15]KKU01284.1 MAG: hypothetical protein UX01_C0001G0128 [Candidatus Collierbacteria bacterium GW2011_GWB2_45_17]KKU04985.1 MAG: hypothetical protein UX08_C0012G0018 [Candidatus Collierbacteria bacterium GW2011_GWB1_45_35]HCX25903.1 hypothetical protein [Candidatus Collierbacteria bacterium]
MARKSNLYRLLRHCTPRNDDVLSHILRELRPPKAGEHKDATAIAGACSQSNSSRPQSGYNIKSRASGSASAKGGPAGEAQPEADGGGETRDTECGAVSQ